MIRRLQGPLADVEGITLFLQPVQDLTVEDRVSRTQFQYSLEDPDGKELAEWVPKFVDKLRTLPELRDVASDQLDDGEQILLVIDRDTASRLGITPQEIDDALYDAFGQRQVSTIFTQAPTSITWFWRCSRRSAIIPTISISFTCEPAAAARCP